MAKDMRRLDAIRSASSELENHYIDELVAGPDQPARLRPRGAVIGMSTTMMGAILSACGNANNDRNLGHHRRARPRRRPPVKGGTLKLASSARRPALSTR